MADIIVPTNTRMAEVSAIVTRCACGAPKSHAGAVCPRGIVVDYGKLAYYHKNPLRRFAWRIYRAALDWYLPKRRLQRWVGKFLTK